MCRIILSYFIIFKILYALLVFKIILSLFLQMSIEKISLDYHVDHKHLTTCSIINDNEAHKTPNAEHQTSKTIQQQTHPHPYRHRNNQSSLSEKQYQEIYQTYLQPPKSRIVNWQPSIEIVYHNENKSRRHSFHQDKTEKEVQVKPFQLQTIQTLKDYSPLAKIWYQTPISYGFLTDRSRIIIGDRSSVVSNDCTLTQLKNKMAKLRSTNKKTQKKIVQKRQNVLKGIKLFCKNK